jgi:nucleoside-diphosphate-sugar epimerase
MQRSSIDEPMKEIQMKVLLTGALGNVGLYTVDALLEAGHDVVAFDLESSRTRKAASQVDRRVRLVWGDITDPASLGAALEGVDAVVHLAALIAPEKTPELGRRVNVDATRSLIALMGASPRARRLVFASSHGIFGDVQDREPPLRIDTPVSPTDEYGRHKIACEQAIQQSSLNWTLLRLAVVPPTRLIGFPHDPSKAFEFSADGRIEFVHPADAGTAFARAVACQEAIGKILYIGGGEKCQMRGEQFTNEIMSAIGIGLIPAEAFVRTEVPRYSGDWVDTAESQRLLQYQKRGLDELKADMKKNLGVIAPMIRLLRPLVTWGLLRRSPYLKQNLRQNRRTASLKGRSDEKD